MFRLNHFSFSLSINWRVGKQGSICILCVKKFLDEFNLLFVQQGDMNRKECWLIIVILRYYQFCNLQILRLQFRMGNI